MRLELAGHTGETDSEDEAEAEPPQVETTVPGVDVIVESSAVQ